MSTYNPPGPTWMPSMAAIVNYGKRKPKPWAIRTGTSTAPHGGWGRGRRKMVGHGIRRYKMAGKGRRKRKH